MTTIAYKDGVLAADSLVTCGNSRDGSMVKIAKRGPVLAAAAGAIGGCSAFLDWFRGGMLGDAPVSPDGPHNWTGVLFTPDDRVLVLENGCWTATRQAEVTMGSGAEFAQGALSMGADPVRAVKVAIMHDTQSGGEITVLRRDGLPATSASVIIRRTRRPTKDRA